MSIHSLSLRHIRVYTIQVALTIKLGKKVTVGIYSYNKDIKEVNTSNSICFYRGI